MPLNHTESGIANPLFFDEGRQGGPLIIAFHGVKVVFYQVMGEDTVLKNHALGAVVAVSGLPDGPGVYNPFTPDIQNHGDMGMTAQNPVSALCDSLVKQVRFRVRLQSAAEGVFR